MKDFAKHRGVSGSALSNNPGTRDTFYTSKITYIRFPNEVTFSGKGLFFYITISNLILLIVGMLFFLTTSWVIEVIIWDQVR